MLKIVSSEFNYFLSEVGHSWCHFFLIVFLEIDWNELQRITSRFFRLDYSCLLFYDEMLGMDDLMLP